MNAAVPIDHALLLASLLFVVGLAGLLTRRHAVFMLVCVEVMLNAAAFAMVAAGARWGEADGQVMFMLVLAVAAAEVAVGLAIVLQLHRQKASLDPDALTGDRDGQLGEEQ